MHDALFHRSGDVFVATEHARGPWDPRACHGGPVAALMTRAVERIDDDPWQLARFTVELLRPVPLDVELSLNTHIERSGRRVSLVAVTLRAGDTEVARARVLRIAIGDLGLPDHVSTGGPSALPPPDSAPEIRMQFPEEPPGHVAFHNEGTEHRYAEGTPLDLGPVAVWIRLRVPVIADETPSGAQRVVAAADFGNGVSAAIPFETFTFINPDLTVHLARPPHGEWIGMRTESHYASQGAGLAESALFDVTGRIGRGVQSLLVVER